MAPGTRCKKGTKGYFNKYFIELAVAALRRLICFQSSRMGTAVVNRCSNSLEKSDFHSRPWGPPTHRLERWITWDPYSSQHGSQFTVQLCSYRKWKTSTQECLSLPPCINPSWNQINILLGVNFMWGSPRGKPELPNFCQHLIYLSWVMLEYPKAFCLAWWWT